MSGIFISYRRQDSSGHAGRLYERLSKHFGKRHVFMDIDTLQPGMDFGHALDRAVAGCDVLIALIGPNWLNAVDADAHRRLDNPDDFVRMEIAAALSRDGVRVIPVLVGNASLPRADVLPDNLQPLARRHSVEISDLRWDFDVGRLIARLETVVTPERRGFARALSPRWLLAIGLPAVFALVGMFAVTAWWDPGSAGPLIDPTATAVDRLAPTETALPELAASPPAVQPTASPQRTATTPTPEAATAPSTPSPEQNTAATPGPAGTSTTEAATPASPQRVSGASPASAAATTADAKASSEPIQAGTPRQTSTPATGTPASVASTVATPEPRFTLAQAPTVATTPKPEATPIPSPTAASTPQLVESSTQAATSTSNSTPAIIPSAGTQVAGIDGAAYTSPRFGYSMSWDPAVWTVPEGGEVGEPGDDTLRLDSDTGTIVVIGTRAYDGNAATCLAEGQQFYGGADGVSDWQTATDANGTELISTSASSAWGVFINTFDDPASPGSEPVQYVDYIRCDSLGDGKSVVIFYTFSIREAHNDHIVDVEAVVDTLELPVTTGNPDGAATPPPIPPPSTRTRTLAHGY